MILDAIPFSSFSGTASDLRKRALGAVINLLEENLGVFVGYDTRRFRFERPDLAEAFRFAALLEKEGVMRSLAPNPQLPDEPPMYWWGAT